MEHAGCGYRGNNNNSMAGKINDSGDSGTGAAKGPKLEREE